LSARSAIDWLIANTISPVTSAGKTIPNRPIRARSVFTASLSAMIASMSESLWDGIDRARLAALTAAERRRFAAEHPRSRALFERTSRSLLAGVPMSWMAKWAAGFPPALAEAHGARVTDLDGCEYVDLCLGDTGAMAGHAPAPVVEAVARRAAAGITAMLPTEDAAWVGEELGRRFALPRWQFALTATDANRWVLRMAREVTGRPKVLVFSWCYHGTVDETFVVLEDGRARSRSGNVGPAVDPATTTRVVEFNDVAGLEEALSHGDVACVLAEPALTNIGIVLPEPGFHAALRELTRAAGALLVIDETHTLSAGPGGMTAAEGLEPDVVTIGKAIAGGVPIGAYGMTEEVAARVLGAPDADLEDVGGVGGTLAGNALSLAAARATLGEVLTPAAHERMAELAARLVAGVELVLAERGVPWHIVRLGARAEYRFTARPPRTGAEAEAAGDAELDDYLHVALMNRGVLLTPFHNMTLMCPATTEADVDRHDAAFAEALDALLG
jgi:glutamate-1-semialdehyde 2,1-aminomutase